MVFKVAGRSTDDGDLARVFGHVFREGGRCIAHHGFEDHVAHAAVKSLLKCFQVLKRDVVLVLPFVVFAPGLAVAVVREVHEGLDLICATDRLERQLQRLLKRRAKRRDRNNGGNSDNNAKHRQERTHPVHAEVGDCLTKVLSQVHVRTPSRDRLPESATMRPSESFTMRSVSAANSFECVMSTMVFPRSS